MALNTSVTPKYNLQPAFLNVPSTGQRICCMCRIRHTPAFIYTTSKDTESASSQATTSPYTHSTHPSPPIHHTYITHASPTHPIIISQTPQFLQFTYSVPVHAHAHPAEREEQKKVSRTQPSNPNHAQPGTQERKREEKRHFPNVKFRKRHASAHTYIHAYVRSFHEFVSSRHCSVPPVIYIYISPKSSTPQPAPASPPEPQSPCSAARTEGSSRYHP